MKKLFQLLCLVFFAISAFSQNIIPNGNFENWQTDSFDYPQNYPYTSNRESFYRFQLPPNVVKTADAYHGSLAVKLSTTASATDTNIGYFINTNPNSGNPFEWKGGVPINQKPTGIRGYYKYNVASADSGTILLTFNKAGVNIGTYFFTIGGIHNTWQLFNFTFTPALTQIPDSVVFGVVSSNIMEGDNGVAGSVLKIDSVSFTGITNQPALMGGDFEIWQSQQLYRIADWFYNDNEDGVSRTADAYAGNYAIELKTFLGENKGQGAEARSGQISTGYWSEACNCMRGGTPFNTQYDTVVFWYKYAPASTDTAEIYLEFTKNGMQVGGAGIRLNATSFYYYMEVPLYAWQTPDTVKITVQSSLWNHTSTQYVGSSLKIDNLHFKSHTVLFPGPVVGTITQPNCNTSTGSVMLSGMPSGNWKLLRTPGGTTTGTGTTTVVTGLVSGTYTFKIINAAGDTSDASSNVIINAQPATPSAPVVGTITQPTCTIATGSVLLSGLPAGNWILTKNPGGSTLAGSGSSTTISGLTAGSTHTFTVSNAAGCTSASSANVVVNAQPATPPTPVITINGFILHSNAASGNQWYNQNGIISGATNQDYTATVNGDYYVIVTLNGCSSLPSNTILVTKVGIEAIELNTTTRFYPNPVSNELTIELASHLNQTNIVLVDAIGQIVFKGSITEKIQIQTTDFAPGVYLILLENDKAITFKKFIKE
ncbi:MAG: T9SS type A sorting domain-containing protein [Bacteroidota bacterium]|nr:T9SS type A sorting domain-containing protein [Bacteroidota bacterium]